MNGSRRNESINQEQLDVMMMKKNETTAPTQTTTISDVVVDDGGGGGKGCLSDQKVERKEEGKIR